MAALRRRRLIGVGLLLLCGCAAPAPRGGSAPPPRDRERAEQSNTDGLALLEQGRATEAEERFRAALDADPFLGAAHSNLGVALLQQGKLYEAAFALRSACSLLPRASQPRTNLGLLFELVGQHGRAEEELRQALSLAPDDIEIVGHLARVHLRQNKHTSETLAWLERVVVEDDDPRWRRWAGETLIRIHGSGSTPQERSP